jgi:hypothetical protein
MPATPPPASVPHDSWQGARRTASKRRQLRTSEAIRSIRQKGVRGRCRISAQRRLPFEHLEQAKCWNAEIITASILWQGK